MSSFQWHDIDLNAGATYTGIILEIDYENLEAFVDCVGGFVPIHYHCTEDPTDDGNRWDHVYPDDLDIDGAKAFSVGDEVLIMNSSFDGDPVIVGFANKAPACVGGGQVLLIKCTTYNLKNLDIAYFYYLYIKPNRNGALEIKEFPIFRSDMETAVPQPIYAEWNGIMQYWEIPDVPDWYFDKSKGYLIGNHGMTLSMYNAVYESNYWCHEISSETLEYSGAFDVDVYNAGLAYLDYPYGDYYHTYFMNIYHGWGFYCFDKMIFGNGENFFKKEDLRHSELETYNFREYPSRWVGDHYTFIWEMDGTGDYTNKELVTFSGYRSGMDHRFFPILPFSNNISDWYATKFYYETYVEKVVEGPVKNEKSYNKLQSSKDISYYTSWNFDDSIIPIFSGTGSRTRDATYPDLDDEDAVKTTYPFTITFSDIDISPSLLIYPVRELFGGGAIYSPHIFSNEMAISVYMGRAQGYTNTTAYDRNLDIISLNSEEEGDEINWCKVAFKIRTHEEASPYWTKSDLEENSQLESYFENIILEFLKEKASSLSDELCVGFDVLDVKAKKIADEDIAQLYADWEF